GANGIKAELPSRPGRATEGSTRTHRGKTKKKGGEGCAAQSRARGSRSPAGCEANDRAALRVTGSAKHSPSCAENVAGSAIAFSARQRPAFTRPVRARPQAPRRQTFDSEPFNASTRATMTQCNSLRRIHAGIWVDVAAAVT